MFETVVIEAFSQLSVEGRGGITASEGRGERYSKRREIYCTLIIDTLIMIIINYIQSHIGLASSNFAALVSLGRPKFIIVFFIVSRFTYSPCSFLRSFFVLFLFRSPLFVVFSMSVPTRAVRLTF